MEVIKGMGNIVCNREREMAIECWKLLYDGELTNTAERNFDSSTCDIYFNTSSGNVFLSDEDMNTIMLNDDLGKLDLWIFLSYNGQEGFKDDLLKKHQECNITHKDDIEQLKGYCTEEEQEKYFKELTNKKETEIKTPKGKENEHRYFKDTKPIKESAYYQSKAEAEKITKEIDEDFKKNMKGGKEKE